SAQDSRTVGTWGRKPRLVGNDGPRLSFWSFRALVFPLLARRPRRASSTPHARAVSRCVAGSFRPTTGLSSLRGGRRKKREPTDEIRRHVGSKRRWRPASGCPERKENG